MSPLIGSEAYKSLSFREQVEIAALKLFHPDEYEELHGGKPKSTSGLTWSIQYPLSLDGIKVVDLPVSFVRNYWAGYSCRFHEKWYADNYAGLTPLDDYGIECKKMVNIWTFTLPLLCLDPAVHYILSYLSNKYSGDLNTQLVLSSVKIYCNMYLKLVEDTAHDLFCAKSNGNPSETVERALTEYSNIHNFVGLNYYCPTVEECSELTWLEVGEFTIYNKPRTKSGRWFYPLVPKGLFTASNFRLSTWQFLR